MKLYELSSEYSNLSSYLNEPDIIDEQIFRQKLAEISEQFHVKAENICKLILSKQAESKALDEEIIRLSNRKRVAENRVTWLKDYVQVEMQNANIEKIEGSVLTVSLQKSPPSCTILDEDLVPLIFKELIPESYKIKRNEILDHFKKTGEIPAGTLIVADKKNLRIR
jgi:hypothetical protein